MKKSLAFALIAQGVSIAVILTIALQFSQQLKDYSEYTAQVEHTYLVIERLEHTSKMLRTAESTSRGYLLTKDSSFVEPFNQVSKETLESLDSLRKLTTDNAYQRKNVQKLEKLVYEKLELQLQNIWSVNKMPTDSLTQRMKYGLSLSKMFEAVMADMKRLENDLLNQRKYQKRSTEAKLPEQVRVVFLIAGLSTLIFGLWIFIELRKRFRFQDQLKEKLLELRQNNEELEQVAFAASHDLQEPLRKIRIFSDRLMSKMQSESDNDESLSIAKRMNNSAARMQGLINDLVKFNNLVQHRDSAELEKVSLEIVVDNEWDKIKELDKTARMEKAALLPDVMGNAEYITTVFSELFSNSYDFRTPEQALHLTVGYDKLKGKEVPNMPRELVHRDYHHVWISDNGIGFDELFKEKMFKLFQRLQNYGNDNEIRRKGMGLAMCRRIMLNLNGWIDAEGELGKGATIHLYFPV